MAKERILTCIVCPRGCQMNVNLSDDGNVESIRGNFCKRGVTYANDECTNPKRTVTSTIRCKSGDVVAVKTDCTIPKDMMFEVMAEINKMVADDEISIGDVIIENVRNTGANVVATANHKTNDK